MGEKMRRNFSGAFAATDRGNGAWRLTGTVPPVVTVHLKDADPGAGAAFGAAPISALAIEWHAGAARLNFLSGGGPATVKSALAIVHEPLDSLYADLPLASVDAAARRLWNRAFLLMRVPGGRYLLKLLARSSGR